MTESSRNTIKFAVLILAGALFALAYAASQRGWVG